MLNDDSKTNDSKEYLEKLMKKTHSHNILSKFIKKTEQHVEVNIQEGSLKIPDQAQPKNIEDITDNLRKKQEINPFDSRYNRFLLNTDREKSQQRFQIFKKIKQEYSKEKTAVMVKDVQNKIKQWTMKKLEIEKRLQKSNQRKKRIEVQQIEQMKRQQLQKKEMENQQKKQQLHKRLKILQEKRQKRENILKQSLIRSRDIKEPKFKQIQQKFKEIQEKIMQQQEKFLEEKRKALTVTKEEKLQHQRKYEKIKKQRQEERLRKMQNPVHNTQSQVLKGQFDAYHLEHKVQYEQGLKKQKRRKQFSEKVKSMASLIKQSNKQEDQDKQINKEVMKERSNQKTKEENKSTIRKRDRSLNSAADPKSIGNEYLKALKIKNKDLLGKSISLPKISTNIETEQRPAYKNYLTQIKLKVKRRQAFDEIQKLKTGCRSKVEVMYALTQKSSEYEQNMIRKIKQLGRIQKYHDSVQKESEIDDLHAKYIKMRLACLD